MIIDTSVQFWMQDILRNVREQFKQNGKYFDTGFFLDAVGHTLTFPISILLHGFTDNAFLMGIAVVRRMMDNLALVRAYRAYAFAQLTMTAKFNPKDGLPVDLDIRNDPKSTERLVVSFETKTALELHASEVVLYSDGSKKLDKDQVLQGFACPSPFMGVLYGSESLPPS